MAVSDADMTRLARLSLLDFPRETSADTAEYERVRAGVSAVLTAARSLQAFSRSKLDSDSSRGGASAADAAVAEPRLRPVDAAIAALSEEDLEAVAQRRWFSLRSDDVTDGDSVNGSDKSITKHAKHTDGPFFLSPTSPKIE